MALLITKQNRPIFLPAEQANLLWLVKTGERNGTLKTRKKAEQVAKWYLNRATAPQSYRDSHPPIESRSYRKKTPQLSLPYKD